MSCGSWYNGFLMSLRVSVTIKTDSLWTQIVFTPWSLLRISPYTHHGSWEIYPRNPLLVPSIFKILRKCKFDFFNAKNWPIFASFDPSLSSSFIFLTFWIELMFPKDGQIPVDDLRHQNFWIWTFLDEVMAILVKKWSNFCKNNAIQWFCKHFSLKWP